MTEKKYQLLIALKIMIAIILISVIVSRVSLEDVWSYFLSADKWLIAGAFLLYFVGFCMIAVRWKLLLWVQGVKVSFVALLKSVTVAVFFNNFLPSTIGGDAVRAYDSWKMGCSKTQSVSIIFIDRLLGIFTLFMFALIALLLSSVELSFIQDAKIWVLAAAALGFLGIYVLFFKAAVVSRYLQKRDHIAPKFLRKFLRKVFDVFAVYNGKPRVLFAALGLSVLLQLNVILHYYLLALSLGIEIPLQSMFIIIPVAIAAMMIPVSINAIGVREAIFVAMLAFYGVSNAAALAFAWLSFFLITVRGVLGGIIFLLRGRTPRKISEVEL